MQGQSKPPLTKAEQQRKLQIILAEKKRTDPSGLLRAHREGTLDAYLAGDLAKVGLCSPHTVTSASLFKSSPGVASSRTVADEDEDSEDSPPPPPAPKQRSPSAPAAVAPAAPAEAAPAAPTAVSSKPSVSLLAGKFKTSPGISTPPDSPKQSAAAAAGTAAPPSPTAAAFSKVQLRSTSSAHKAVPAAAAAAGVTPLRTSSSSDEQSAAAAVSAESPGGSIASLAQRFGGLKRGTSGSTSSFVSPSPRTSLGGSPQVSSKPVWSKEAKGSPTASTSVKAAALAIASGASSSSSAQQSSSPSSSPSNSSEKSSNVADLIGRWGSKKE
eukprot:6817-Heterococcus_DN1.PRE.2